MGRQGGISASLIYWTSGRRSWYVIASYVLSYLGIFYDSFRVRHFLLCGLSSFKRLGRKIYAGGFPWKSVQLESNCKPARRDGWPHDWGIPWRYLPCAKRFYCDRNS